MVQQTDISWSNLILGNEALAHIKIKIKIQDLIPNINAEMKESKIKKKKSLFSSIKFIK